MGRDVAFKRRELKNKTKIETKRKLTRKIKIHNKKRKLQKGVHEREHNTGKI
jgi:hypothetical protein